jgi:hypothetical protein
MKGVMTDDERKERLAMAQISNLDADTDYKRGLLRFEPWKIVIASAAAGGALVAGGAAALGLILHLMGKL